MATILSMEREHGIEKVVDGPYSERHAGDPESPFYKKDLSIKKSRRRFDRLSIPIVGAVLSLFYSE